MEDVGMGGPGRYISDVTEGIVRVEDLPKARVSERSRNFRHRTCPEGGRSAYPLRTVVRRLHDLGDLVSGRPRDIQITYSQHHCLGCDGYFNADMEDLAPPKSHYTHRVIHTAVRLGGEKGPPNTSPARILTRPWRTSPATSPRTNCTTVPSVFFRSWTTARSSGSSTKCWTTIQPTRTSDGSSGVSKPRSTSGG